MEDVTITPAGPEHARIVARLWADAFPLKFGCIFSENAEGFLENWLALDPSVFAGTYLARRGEDVVGYVHLESRDGGFGGVLGALIARWDWGQARMLLSAARRRWGWPRALLSVARIAVLEADPSAPRYLHIKMIGARADQRGVGIGTHLLEFAEAQARARGLERMSLGVVSENTAAKRLYERFGFVAEPEARSRILRWACGSPGYFRMVKTLEPTPSA